MDETFYVRVLKEKTNGEGIEGELLSLSARSEKGDFEGGALLLETKAISNTLHSFWYKAIQNGPDFSHPTLVVDHTIF